MFLVEYSETQIVVVMELQVRQQSSGKMAENGEEIVMEGVCDHKGVYLNVLLLALAVSLLGVALAIPAGFLFAKVAVKRFELYLTKKSIYYHQAYPNCCGIKTWVIPLSYIRSIYALDTKVRIYMEKDKAIELLGCCFPSFSVSRYPYLQLKYVENCEEFVQAVKREMAVEREMTAVAGN